MKKSTLSLLIAGIISTASFAEDPCDATFQAKNYDQASQCYVLQLKKEQSFHNLKRAGISFMQQGRYSEAFSYLKEAEKKAASSQDYLVVYNTLSIVYSAMGDSSQELAYDMKTLNLTLKSANRAQIGTSYTNLGSYFDKQNQPQKALEYYTKALEYQEESQRSTTYGNMALTYNKLNNLQKSEDMQHKSIEIAEKTGDLNSLSQQKMNLAFFYFNHDRPSDARKTAFETLTIARQAHTMNIESHALSLLAIYDYRDGHINEARTKASEALRLAKQSGENGVVLADAQYAWNLANGK